jgi:RHS repeat-associated protein
VLTRTWARGVVTTYGYTAGQLTSVEYSNDPTNTPTVNIAYDRLGRITDQSNDRSTTDYDYDPASLRLIREETTIDPDGAAGPLPSLTRTIDRSRDNLQRPTGFVLGNEHAVGYGYDVSGRLATLSAQGLPNLPGKAHAFEYLYAPGSSLISKVTGPVHEVDNTYETNRNVLSEKKNTRTVGTPGELSVIGYTVNEIGQREQRNLRGEIRSDFYRDGQGDPTDPEALYATGWTYDALGQVTGEDKPAPLQENEPDPDRGYSYDLIGNRKTSTLNGITTTYSANALNQYTSMLPPPQGEGGGEGSPLQPAYDQDGNMTTGLLNGSGNGEFEYDGANQLILTQATATSDPTRYAYDAFGRRIAKVTYPNGSAVASAATVFLYDGWNPIAEYKLDSGAWALDRTYTWGIDLSGSTQGAGGVGGLLAVRLLSSVSSSSVFYTCFDGNGNIEAYIDSNGQPAAIYQYDSFGNVLTGGGKGAAIEQARFSHRFSTKYQDSETGLLYYGYRYYHAALGRWLNRDPIEESGGVNLYAMSENDLVTQIDLIGLSGGGAGHGYTIIGPAKEWTFDFGKALGKTKDFHAKVPVGLVGSGDMAMRINGFYGTGTKTPICCSEGDKAKTSVIFEGKVHASVGFEVGYTIGWLQAFDFSIVRGRLLFGVRGFFKGAISGGGSVVYDGCKDEMRWGISASGVIAGGLEGGVGVYHQWRSIFGGYGDENFFGATVFAEGGLTGDVFFRCSGKQCESGGGVNPYATVGWRIGLGGPFTLEDSKTIHGDPLSVGPFYYQNPFGKGDI